LTAVHVAPVAGSAAPGAQSTPALGYDAPPPAPERTPPGAPPVAKPSTSASAPPAAVDGMIERGAYLVKIGGCNDCHTPVKVGPNGPEPDADRLLSGHPQDLRMPPPPALERPWAMVTSTTNTAFAGPWGTSYASNLTPDEDTGIGSWTEETFAETMRTGRHGGTGRKILPPMPWQNVARLTDDDLRSVFRYLTSIPPIDNRVPEAVLSEESGESAASSR